MYILCVSNPALAAKSNKPLLLDTHTHEHKTTINSIQLTTTKY